MLRGRVRAVVGRHPYLSLFVLSLAVRAATARLFTQPGYMDAYFYFNLGESLATGRGLTAGVIWNYLSEAPAVVHPETLYWMPGTAVLIAGALSLFGSSFGAAQVPSILLAATLPPIAYFVGVDALGSPRRGWLLAWLTIFSGIFFPYWTTTDSFAAFAVVSALCLICCYRGVRDGGGYLVAAGFLAGLGALFRADGALLLVPVVGTWLAARRGRTWYRGATLADLDADPLPVKLHGRVQTLVLAVGAFLLAASPAVAYSLAAQGTPLASGGARAAFLREYDDLYSFQRPLDLAYLLNLRQPDPDWGLLPLLLSRARALGENLLIVARPALIYLVPLSAIGLWGRPRLPAGRGGTPDGLWRSVEFVPFLLYTASLYLVMSLVFTFPGTRGSVFHSSGGLLPFVFGAAVVGLERWVAWISARHRPRAAASRLRFYTSACLVGAVAVSLGWTLRLAASWNDDYRATVAVADWLARQGPETVPMVADPPAYYYVSHRPAIVLASDGVDANLAAAARYGATHLVLQPGHAPRSLAALYQARAAPGLAWQADLGDIQIYEIPSRPPSAEGR